MASSQIFTDSKLQGRFFSRRLLCVTLPRVAPWQPYGRRYADCAVVSMLRVVQEKHIVTEINLERAKPAGRGTKCANAGLTGRAAFTHPVTQ